MSREDRSQFPLRVIILPALATAVPLSSLLWTGWRVLEKNLVLEEQQIRRRIERAADIVTAALQRAVAATGKRLSEGSGCWLEGAISMTIEGASIHFEPAHRVTYIPALPRLPSLPAAHFATAESAEYGQRDRNRAMKIYRDLARSHRPEIRARSLLRLARCL